MNINDKLYRISDSQVIKEQSIADDVQVYGWTLEFRGKDRVGEWNGWSNYNNHIYNGRNAAIEAAIKIYKGLKPQTYEWRLIPLYKMTQPQYRDLKKTLNTLVGEVNSTYGSFYKLLMR